MNLLSRTLPQIEQFLRRPRVFTSVVVLSLAGLEALGRTITSDIYDTFAATGLMILVAVVLARHRERPLHWMNWLERRGLKILEKFARWRVEVGIDLRGKPPIRRRTPMGIRLTMAALMLWGTAAFAVWYFSPDGWRTPMILGTYLGYLILASILWGGLLAGILGCVYVPMMLWSHLYPGTFYRSNAPRSSKIQTLGVVLGYLALIVSAWYYLPMWGVVAGCAAALLLLQAARLLRGSGAIAIIWRPRQSNRVYSVPVGAAAIDLLTLVVLVSLAMLLTATGGRVLGSSAAENEMAVTVILGGIFAWTLPGMLIAVLVGAWLFRSRDPSRPAQPSVHISGYFAPRQRSILFAAFRSRGWQIRFDPVLPEATDVCIHLVEQEQSQATEFDPEWPLRVSLNDLQAGDVFGRLERRDELQKRRLFFRGLREIFREIRGADTRTGAGYWLAPHLWFQPAMTRDEELEEREGPALMQTVGPLYRDVFERSVRHHLFQILRAVEVDIIFVEDGVRFRRMRSVFKRIFDMYDKSRGQKRIEEIHFLGLVRVRVMLHDLQLDMPFESSRYPEPKFEILGRARVLHIFRDRGDQEDLLQTPSDFSWSPAPYNWIKRNYRKNLHNWKKLPNFPIFPLPRPFQMS